MRCIIIEDEAPALQILEAYARKVPMLEVLAGFRNPIEAVRFLQQNEVDLIFIDINMPELTGLELVRSLPHPPLVIFTTAYSEYAAESYDLDAVDYLLKPIPFDRFLRAVNKAARQVAKTESPAAVGQVHERKDKAFFVKSGSLTHRLLPEDILYIEAENNYVKYVTADKKILSLDRLSRLEQELPASQFIRVHKSFLVAIHQIDLIQKTFVEIQGRRIAVGRVYRSAFFEHIDAIGRQGN